MPGRATSRWWKEEREGVFIDYNQNARDRTVASAYSVRAVPDARVSCPLEWDEVADVEPAGAAPATPCPRGCASAATRRRASTRTRAASTALLELAARDEREGLGDAPWPPHFRKQKGEPPRVQPSRARSREGRRSEAAMTLPLEPPLKPQLALSRKQLPEGEDYVYEIKLDGFRCLAFVDGEEVFLQSRNGKPLGRYFPELVLPRGRYVLDGEIVVRGADGREDFDALGQRIHPAVSRIERLAVETPAVYVAFDLLARDDESLLERPLEQRRAALEQLLGENGFAGAPVELIGRSRRPSEARAVARARRGRDRQGALGGLPPGRAQGHGQGQARAHDRRRHRRLASRQGARHGRRADPRPLRRRRAARGRSLLRAERRREAPPGRASSPTMSPASAARPTPAAGVPARTCSGSALRPELVVEIDFDHVSAGRIRHGAKLRRWREDKPAAGVPLRAQTLRALSVRVQACLGSAA